MHEEIKIDQLLQLAVDEEAESLSLKVGASPTFQIKGECRPADLPNITAEDMGRFVLSAMDGKDASRGYLNKLDSLSKSAFVSFDKKFGESHCFRFRITKSGNYEMDVRPISVDKMSLIIVWQ